MKVYLKNKIKTSNESYFMELKVQNNLQSNSKCDYVVNGVSSMKKDFDLQISDLKFDLP